MNYFADTPVGAWAEFLRHEGITDPADLAGVRRALWAVELPDEGYAAPTLPEAIMRGDERSYPLCQQEATRLRATGVQRIVAPSAALVDGGARGWIAFPTVETAPLPRSGRVFVLFGRTPELIGWPAVMAGAPSAELLPLVRQL